ncbi:MAG: cytochrome c [Calditrichaeota bacterium]|nr:MAG: cytochrome c [Calditrichota bacterium]
MKKSIFIVLIGLSILAIGCGGGGGEQAGTTTQKAKPQAQAQVKQAALPKGDPVRGKELYTQSCSACHGPDAKGIPGLGKDLTTSQFAMNLSDAELLDYIKKGRSTDDPLNTTGVAMPPKGGNPSLTDKDIMDIIAYIRTLEHKG